MLVQSWPRPVGHDFEQSLYLLLAAVGMVLLIACANIANLALARGAATAPEMAIRAALGASRGRLARQALTETLMIAIAGGLGGLAVGYAVLVAIRAVIPSVGLFRAVPSETIMGMDAPVWLFALALAVLSGMAWGMGPALGVTRPALNGVIKERGGAGGSAGRALRRLRQTLVVAEVALAFVLLTSAGLLIRSFFAVQAQISVGFDSTNVLTARLPIPARRFDGPEALNAYLDRMADRIQSLPGIRDVAFAEGLPTQGTPFGVSFQRADQPPVEGARRPFCEFKTVSPSYFRAVGLRILNGRALADRDRAGAPFVVVINETFARTYFPGGDPIGQRLLMGAASTRETGVLKDTAWDVIGVVGDEGLSPWTRAAAAVIYVTREQHPSDYLALIVRGTLDPVRLQESIRKAVSAFDRDQALTNVQTLDQVKTEAVASDRLRSTLLDAFAAIAVALAMIGLYGVLAYAVVQRRREIGIRAALGASPASLVTLVVRQGFMMAAMGLAIGLVGVLIMRRLLAAVLFGVQPSDPATIATVAGVLAGVALAASYGPARRAINVDPFVALRCE